MSWDQALGDLEQALDAFEAVGLEDAAKAADVLGALPPAPLVTGPIPFRLQALAQRLQGRLNTLISDIEARRAVVGSELAAIGAATAASGSDRPVPKFLDTRA